MQSPSRDTIVVIKLTIRARQVALLFKAGHIHAVAKKIGHLIGETSHKPFHHKIIRNGSSISIPVSGSDGGGSPTVLRCCRTLACAQFRPNWKTARRARARETRGVRLRAGAREADDPKVQKRHSAPSTER